MKGIASLAFLAGLESLWVYELWMGMIVYRTHEPTEVGRVVSYKPTFLWKVLFGTIFLSQSDPYQIFMRYQNHGGPGASNLISIIQCKGISWNFVLKVFGSSLFQKESNKLIRSIIWNVKLEHLKEINGSEKVLIFNDKKHFKVSHLECSAQRVRRCSGAVILCSSHNQCAHHIIGQEAPDVTSKTIVQRSVFAEDLTHTMEFFQRGLWLGRCKQLTI